MPFPKGLKYTDECTLYIGFTEILVSNNKKTITITHSGNMGNNINSVRKNVDTKLGKGWFDKLEIECRNMVEKGYPDYYYERILKF